ncbi:hypothetical protein [Algoriphagus confluentis]|uniref:Uncharacterized protein n=1 Tax=Algoriphagus confluentis TaxID=1697556 RepID=A0ABQ6PL61_9BACT|nr:hypothetical protein Aconfl_09150 [Algoriphagus confluentis]
MVTYISLPEKFVAALEKLPETGMGYQVVKIKFKDGKILEKVMVINSDRIKLDKNIAIDFSQISKIELDH